MTRFISRPPDVIILLRPRKSLDFRGSELRVGIPPYNTPPYYYKAAGPDGLAGYDIDVARTLAKRLGVDVVFDQQSSSFDARQASSLASFSTALDRLPHLPLLPTAYLPRARQTSP